MKTSQMTANAHKLGANNILLT